MTIYQGKYALEYDDNWVNNPKWEPEMDYIKSLIASNLSYSKKWLDAGCGTGFFLKKFKGYQRAGFDISMDMLKIAKERNEDCLFITKHDISKPNDAWNNSWDFISCTGQPWCYLESIFEIEKVCLNFYNWLYLTGKCLLVPDDVQIAFNVNYNYNFNVNEFQNKPQTLNALICSFKDNYVIHRNMIFPMLDQWVRWFSVYFERIDIYSKKFETHIIPRTYIICSYKRETPQYKNAEIFINNKPLEIYIKKYGIDNINNETLFMK